MLRGFAPAFDVKAFLSRFPRLDADAVWSSGEKTLFQRPHGDSDFDLTLAEAAARLVSTSAFRCHSWRIRPSSLAARSRLNAVLFVGMFISAASSRLVLARWGWVPVTVLATVSALVALLVRLAPRARVAR
ncbi:hypothetical protein BHS05_08315 [Myxococcus xanthus]|nr:hypothetical protein BHS05_08315 [Myxococcus xanthus]